MIKKIILFSVLLLSCTLGFSQVKIIPKTKTKIQPKVKIIEYSLTISTNVKNYTIYIDGEEISGNRATLSPGKYYIEVEADGYGDYSRTLNISRNTVIKAVLKRVKKVRKANISIYIPEYITNNRQYGSRNQFEIYDNGNLVEDGLEFEVIPGNHTIRIESGIFAIEENYDFSAGESYTIEPVLYLEMD